MIQSLLWLLVVVAAAYSQHRIIDKSQRVPIHLLWFIIRGITFGLFLWWYWASGYYIVWAAPFMITTFAFWFPTLLNRWRGKKTIYLSHRGYDKLMRWIFGEEEKVFWFLLMMMIVALPLHVYYNLIELTSFGELW